MKITPERRQELETLFRSRGYDDFKWIDPDSIIVARWVRMKCMFGCADYGRIATCPPNTPPVEECERFFKEYDDAAVFHMEATMEKAEDRHAWSAKTNMELVKLEREVFLSGFEKAFLLPMDSCNFCKECSGGRPNCNHPTLSRPTVEAMAVDVYATVRNLGYEINVLTDRSQKMNRFAFLMVN